MYTKLTGCKGNIFSSDSIAKINTQFVIIQEPHAIDFLPRIHLRQENRVKSLIWCSNATLLPPSLAAFSSASWCLLPQRFASLTFCSCGANNTLPGIRGSNLKNRKIVGGREARVNVLVKFFTREATLFGKKIWLVHALATAPRPRGKGRLRRVALTCSNCNSTPV